MPPEPPAADAFEPPAGPGGPARTFDSAELFAGCGQILGGPGDAEHHNLSVMHDGWLVHPWAPESGGGGVSFFGFDDPCRPVLVGQGTSERMRETHTLAFGTAGDREYLAVDSLDPDDGYIGGVGFWDVTDPTAPVWAGDLPTPGFHYPDSYLQVTFASTWVGPTLYVSAAFNGLHVIDASDPLDPVLVTTVKFDPPHLVGVIHVVGNLGVVTSAGLDRVVLLDLSDPWDPRPIPGGDFLTRSAEGDPENSYFSSLSGRYALFARKDRGGGPIAYDLTDPSAPVFAGEVFTEGADGGYVYRQGDRLFQGESNFGVVYDFADPTAPFELVRVAVAGDLDTMSPIGNVMVVSVDENGLPGQASTVMPWRETPDDDPPAIELVSPMAGTVVPPTSRIGLSFDEWIESASVFEGSFRVTDAGGWPIAGTFNVQEALVNFTPDEPLPADATVVITIPRGGITDLSGNPVAEDLTWQFDTSP